MNEKALNELSFFRIRDDISSYALSTEGKKLLDSRIPFSTSEKDLENLSHTKTLSHQWMTFFSANKASPFSSWPEISPLFSYLNIGGAALNREQFFSFLQFVNAAISASEVLASTNTTLHINALALLSEKLPYQELSTVRNLISRVIDNSGQIKDLPELREIKSRIAKLHAEINNVLKAFTQNSQFQQYLESNVPVIRGERQVLAVKAAHKNKISGIVSSVSQSGQTLFIEPTEAVRKNNELIEEEYHLEAETKKIFRELTEKVSEFSGELQNALKIMSELDASAAAAKWGIENNCSFASDCNGEPPLLVQARHPLLGQSAVPLDIRFIAGKNVLIITGPNTGGKTVALKTFALCSMLNQAGFPVPATESSRLPVFDNFYCDIGDEQSIDASLSTFSAHTKNIAEAVLNATDKTLVLLDELGSGTDPQEGGAIAMAVLDDLIEKKSTVLVTTHHGLLKNYGFTNPSCINASVEFDENTLSPTYRILMGVPGVSHALDIAKRSGLELSIVDKARKYIEGHQADVSLLIKNLTEKFAQINETEKELNSKNLALLERERRLEDKIFRMREKENALARRELDKKDSFLKESRKKLENLVRVLREGEINREKTLAVKQFIADLENNFKNDALEIENEDEKIRNERLAAKERIEKENEENRKNGIIAENGMTIKSNDRKNSTSKKNKKRKGAGAAALENAELHDYTPLPKNIERNLKKIQEAKNQKLEFKIGAKVLAGPLKMNAVLLSEERKGLWTVQSGAIKMKFKEKDMILVGAADSPKKATVTLELDDTYTGEDSIFKKTPDSRDSALFELRLLGMRWDDAKKALEHQLDLCAIENFKNFSVIHGKGNGILQQNVQDFLSHYPTVKEFHFAPPEDGGFGKTYVTLR